MSAPPSLRRFLRRFQQGRCFLCGLLMQTSPRRGFDWRRDPERETVDHVVPHAAGGRRPNNSLLACQRCNNDKGDRMPFACEVFYAQEAHRAYAAAFEAWWRAHTYHGRRLARLEASQRRKTG